METVPKGRTVLMFKPERLLTQRVVPYICSADGLLIKTTGSVNLFGQAIIIKSILDSSTIIARFPYSHTLYLISTGGLTYEDL